MTKKIKYILLTILIAAIAFFIGFLKGGSYELTRESNDKYCEQFKEVDTCANAGCKVEGQGEWSCGSKIRAFIR